MSAREKPIDRAARLLDLIPFIVTHQGIHIEELAREFQISVGEIAKDLDLLFMCGLPSYTPLELIDLSYEGGFVTIKDAQNLDRPRKLNTHEISTLLLGLSVLRTWSIEPENIVRISGLERKLKLILGIQSEQYLALTEIDPKIRRTLITAITNETTLSIEYLNPTKDRVTERTISPFEIVLQGGRENLLAFCHLTNGRRTFDLGNILSITEGSEKFSGSETEPQLMGGSSETVSISYEGSGLTFIERNPELIIEHDPRSKTAKMRYWSSEWFARSVMSYGGTIRISEPEVIKQSILARVKATKSRYK